MILESIKSEYVRYKNLGDKAIGQVKDDDLGHCLHEDGNSIAVLVQHIAGNLKSRFTDFLTTDGEKSWRHRDEEFIDQDRNRTELMAEWEKGWTVLFKTLDELTDDHLAQELKIRGQSLSVAAALHRSLAHTSYHVGQVVLIARALLDKDWQCLSIPRGQSEQYNQNPTLEKGPKPQAGVHPLGRIHLVLYNSCTPKDSRTG